MSDEIIKNYSPLNLAFMGDAIYEILVRERLVKSANRPVGELHRLAVERVCAAYQAKASERLSTVFSETEADIFRKGRNAGGVHIPKSASPSEYHKATGLEAVFGYLYLKGEMERIRTIFEFIMQGE
jgi:ribonuclease-3 family protein